MFYSCFLLCVFKIKTLFIINVIKAIFFFERQHVRTNMSWRQKPDTDEVNDSLFSVLLMLIKKSELKIKMFKDEDYLLLITKL